MSGYQLEKRILLVEDNPTDELLILRALQKQQILNPVVVARDGAEALEILRHSEPPPDLVLLDLKLPKVDGLEVLREMRKDERTRLLPVVVLTSSAEEPDIVESYRLGANSYVPKPVAFDELAGAVRQLGQYWLVLNRTASRGMP